MASYVMPDEDVTLYAIYKRTYTATFAENGASRIYPEGTSYSASWNKQLTCDVWNNQPTCNIRAPKIERNDSDVNNKFNYV
jgi:hypothetical protein